MSRKYLVNRNNNWILERRSHPPKEEHIQVDDEVQYACCYTIFTDEDGTKTALVSERKLADKLNEEKRRQYELSKQR